jgi:hypothetical protein
MAVRTHPATVSGGAADQDPSRPRPKLAAFGVLMLAALTALAASLMPGSAGGQNGARDDLFAQLRGSHEVTDTGQTGAGDRDGRGSFAALISGRRLCFAITVTGIRTPVAAHIHRANAGSNGAIVVPLQQPRRGAPGTSSGCVSAAASLLADIQSRPQRYYANVHTGDFPGGAVRGQLFHPTSRQDR